MYHEHERDTLAFSRQLYTDTPRQLAFQATTLSEAEAVAAKASGKADRTRRWVSSGNV